jgi:hypothetical protein
MIIRVHGMEHKAETYENLMESLVSGYNEEDAATQWHMRRAWARMMQRWSGMTQGEPIEDDALDCTSEQSLFETAAELNLIELEVEVAALTSSPHLT